MDEDKINQTLEKVLAEYESSRNQYEGYCSAVYLICETLLKNNAIESYSITKRTKAIGSLRNKLIEIQPDGKSRIEKISNNKYDWRTVQDLSGVRIIFSFEQDLHKFINVIQSELGSSIEVKYPDKSRGYDSIHLTLVLGKERTKLPEYADFKGLICEIQLRTILDHAWAETSHRISYKPDTIYEKKTTDRLRDTIDKKLKEIRVELIEPAKTKLNALHNFYSKVRSGSEILDKERLSQIALLDSNNIMFSELNFLAESLSSFHYLLPSDVDVFSLIQDIVKKAKSNKVIEDKNGMYATKGKTVFDIAKVCLRVIDTIKYANIPESIRALNKISKLKDMAVKSEAIKVFKNISRYDYEAIKVLGYLPQQDILEFLQSNRLDPEIVKTIATELLDPAFEGTRMPDPQTVSWLSGALPVDNSLVSIRDTVIELLFEELALSRTIKQKLSIIKVLDVATSLPQRSKFGDDLINLVANNIKLLVKKYSEILFGPNNKIIAELPIAKEIESQLFIRDKDLRKLVPEAKELIEKIRKDERFGYFRLLGTGKFEYEEDKDFRILEAERDKKIDDLFNSLNSHNIKNFADIFSDIANYYDPDQQWQWHSFKDLLVKIAIEKPNLAEIIMGKALNEKGQLLLGFSTDILSGFRKANNYTLWKKYVDQLLANKSLDLIRSVLDSYWGVMGERFDELADDRDIDLLSDAVNGKGQFSKLHLDKINDIKLHNSLINALICIYKKNPKRVEELIISEFNQHSELANLFLSSINIGLIRDEISLESWEDKSLDILIGHLVRIDDISHNVDHILLNLDPEKILNLFSKRIEHRLVISSKKRSAYYEYIKYDPIPSYLDPKLIEQIQKYPGLNNSLEFMIKQMNTKDPFKGMLIGEFVRLVGGKEFQEIKEEMISQGGDDQLKKVINLMHGVSPVSIDECFEIAKMTDNPKILQSLESRFFSTGVVSGEYGIYETYKSKIKQVEKIKDDNPDNERVQKFAKRVICDLDSHAEAEKKRVEETKELRNLEFET